MFKSSGSTLWKPIVSTVAALGVAVLAFAGLAHFRHQRATAAQIAASAPAIRADQATRVRENFAALPLAFEANLGQTDPQVKYLARGSGYTVFLTQDETVFALHSSSPASSVPPSNPAERLRQRLAQKQINSSISMKLAGGNSPAEIAAQNELSGRSNYFIGSDPSQWHTGVKQYSRVSYRDVYPGVDMAFHGRQRQLEFDFIVAPNASAAPIGFEISGANKISTDADGNLVLASKAGNVLLHKPVAYQEKNNTREPVDASFVVEANNKIAFTLGNYDRSRELVIDPSVTYATFLGGTAEDDAFAIAVHGGNAYVTGQTASTNFPTKSPLISSNQGSFDAFVTEISSAGVLQYSTYLGGGGSDSGNAIAVDASGNAYVTGGTNSNNFPAKGAYQTYQGGLDAFVTELDSTGSTLVFSTYLGGSGDDVGKGIAVDTTGVYVVGKTASGNFPGVINGFQTTLAGGSGSFNGFVAKITPAIPVVLAYSSYLGGGTGDYASSVAVDSNHQAYVTGGTLNASGTFPITTSSAVQTKCGGVASGCGGKYDAFVTVVNPATSGASSLVYSTFFGGTGDDQAFGIALDGSGDAYITGETQSMTTFPLNNALQNTFSGTTQDAFVAEINPANPPSTALIYSTYLGGSLSQAGTGIAVDGNGNAYVTGQTNSPDFPKASATQGTLGGGNDAFISKIAAGGGSGSLAFSTYLGGSQDENSIGSAIGAIAVDSSGPNTNIYVAGNTASSNFPKVNPEQSTYGGAVDAFVAAYSVGSFTITNGALSNTSGSPGVLSSATITVTPAGGFNSDVTLSCGVTPAVASGPTCGFTGNPVANGSGTATLNVATTKASARLDRPNGPSGMIYAMILPVFGLALVGAGFGPSGSRRRKLFGFLMIGIVLSGLLLLPACSSNSTSSGGGGTPPGTYTITVTGSGGGATATGSPALTLTVN